MERYGKNFSMSSKAREPWRYTQNIYHGEGHDPLTSGFSWPPRSYTCSFCKREFRSAQALGGHMNVHRRDRARLRQSPPWNSTNTNPSPPAALSTNPNKVPNLNSPPPPSSHVTDATKISPLSPYSLPSPLSRRPSRSSSASSADLFCEDAREVKDLLQKNDMLQNNRREMLRLDLEIGMCGYMKEDLDLELRLGCS